jgi:hypothetical protein
MADALEGRVELTKSVLASRNDESKTLAQIRDELKRDNELLEAANGREEAWLVHTGYYFMDNNTLVLTSVDTNKLAKLAQLATVAVMWTKSVNTYMYS